MRLPYWLLRLMPLTFRVIAGRVNGQPLGIWWREWRYVRKHGTED